ncbi:tRNA: m1A22 methyltransferase [Spiroplasma sabaudiense Ar-1343]|uniref:tRNA: m1A22 methyltransferase n=1 Tax=Spiroplasma sabaudiense Ar-1343 TaxID=1276257 RepID=W6A9T9_9MOLU|nr:class I SAM-dependent methyltransferase [Spiroplasma sabaudiense]AHI53736.1 tRNA: m1A22 methyltransferase [Spiroplasma sabaudiense Ar-1343]
MKFLTPRLITVASLINDDDDIIADIGTDHAYLPIYLAKGHKVEYVYASDINKKPFETALQNVKNFGVNNMIEVIHGPGISWIKERSNLQIDCCVISGMGSTTILDILKEDNTKINSYIFSSNTNVLPIRSWVRMNKYFIESEVLVEDNDIIYEIIKVNKFAGKKIRSLREEYFGPLLIKNRNKLFIEKWATEEEKLNKILVKLPKNDSKIKKIKKELKMIKKHTNKEMRK